jgi:hypothetical protein
MLPGKPIPCHIGGRQNIVIRGVQMASGRDDTDSIPLPQRKSGTLDLPGLGDRHTSKKR